MDPISGNFIDAKDIATHWPTYLEGAEKAGKNHYLINGELAEAS